MSDKTPQSGEKDEPTRLDASGDETPVGDAWEEGQTEIGPHPELTHLQNLGQADLEHLAGDDTAKGPDG